MPPSVTASNGSWALNPPSENDEDSEDSENEEDDNRESNQRKYVQPQQQEGQEGQEEKPPVRLRMALFVNVKGKDGEIGK